MAEQRRLFEEYRPGDHGTPAPVAVRPLEAGDVAACAGLAFARDGGDPARWADSFRACLDDEERQVFVALAPGLVGYGIAALLRPSLQPGECTVEDGWYLAGLVVEARARRRGVGSALTAARLEWLADRTDRVYYVANSRNRASLALHEGFGFTTVATGVVMPGLSFTGGEGVLAVRRFSD